MPTVIYDHQTFVAQEFGGISRYFCELASRIHGYDGFKAKVIAPLHLNAYLPQCSVPQAAVRLKGKFRGRGKLCQVVNGIMAPVLTWGSSPSLIHRTYYSPIKGGSRVPIILSVFDMIHELFPKEFDVNDPVVLNKRLCVSKADHIICISQSTANDLMQLFDVSPSKISVTHLGYSEVFTRQALVEELSPHDRPYLLYVGQRSGYKNFKVAIQAYAASNSLRKEFDFICFGGQAFNNEEQALFRDLSISPNNIIQLSGSDADLARAYRNARAFIYPSKYEGFGIPPLEAMSSGCVVVCSNTSSIPEVVGNAALMFDPNDVDEFRKAIELACFSEGAREQLIAAGAKRVRGFTWDRCARETALAYKRAMGA